MLAEYRKQGIETYLWVACEAECGDYTEKMAECNPGDARLPFFRNSEDGEEFYCYNITGKKALNGIYAMMPVGERQIRNILLQLFSALEKSRSLLLREEDYVIAPQYIFATLPKMELEFCYLPGYGIPLKQQLEGLFEYFLNRVDYEDKTAVELLYDCYMFCVKEKGNLADIKALIEKEVTLQEEEQALPIEENMPLETQPESEFQSEEPEEPPAYFSWLVQKLFRKKKCKVVLEESKEEEGEKEKEREQDVIWDNKSVGNKAEEKTVLLAVAQEKATVKLTNLSTGEVISVNKLPYYIGSVDNYADYIPKGPGISRVHCCITQKGEQYFVSDLNSTNGTFLDGKEILPGSEVLLCDGAMLRVATMEFYVNLPCH